MAKELEPRLLPRKRIIGRASWKFYKENCNKSYFSNNVDRDNHPKIVKAIFKKAAERLIENKSGVFLNKLGYFCIMMYPGRMMIKDKASKTGAKYFNVDTNHRIYSPQWIYNMYNDYYTWTMDRTFSRTTIRVPLSKLLKAGKKYIMEYKLVSSLKHAK